MNCRPVAFHSFCFLPSPETQTGVSLVGSLSHASISNMSVAPVHRVAHSAGVWPLVIPGEPVPVPVVPGVEADVPCPEVIPFLLLSSFLVHAANRHATIPRPTISLFIFYPFDPRFNLRLGAGQL